MRWAALLLVSCAPVSGGWATVEDDAGADVAAVVVRVVVAPEAAPVDVSEAGVEDAWDDTSDGGCLQEYMRLCVCGYSLGVTPAIIQYCEACPTELAAQRLIGCDQ
jgi:hypothetical protein